MKHQILTSAIAIGFAALIATTPAVAQTKHTATIPFAFEAGGTEYPSGTYEIQKMGTHSIVQIRNVDTGKGNMIAAPVPVGTGTVTSPKLVFQTTANGYRLSEFWLQGGHAMRTFKSSKGDESASVKVAIK